MFTDNNFSSQINLAGLTVFVLSYYFTQDIKSAAVITAGHATAHYIVGHTNTNH